VLHVQLLCNNIIIKYFFQHENYLPTLVFHILSFVNSQVQRTADNVGVASDVQKRCGKRKSVGMFKSHGEGIHNQQYRNK